MDIRVEPAVRDYIAKKDPQKAITIGVGIRGKALIAAVVLGEASFQL